MMKTAKFVFLVLVAVVAVADAFVVAPGSTTSVTRSASSNIKKSSLVTTSTSSTALNAEERRWNFNSDGRKPWGIKRNAETWNGRVAQMGFTIIMLQELITGKGAVTGLLEGDPFNIFMTGATVATIVGLTAWLAFKASQYEEFQVPEPLGTQWKGKMDEFDENTK